MKHPHPIQISVPQPCTEDWNKMTPLEQGRFCDSCQKCVVDFTAFTDEQLYKYFAEHKGKKVCGRIKKTQLNRQINIPYQPHSTLYKWMMVAGLALVFVALPERNNFAQTPMIQQSIHDTSPNQPDKDADSIKISGIVVDNNNDPVVAAIVIVRSADIEEQVVTDFDGNYSVTMPPGTYELAVRYIGFKESVTKNIKGDFNVRVDVKIQPSDQILSGEIIIIHSPHLIDGYSNGQSKTLTSDEVEKGAY